MVACAKTPCWNVFPWNQQDFPQLPGKIKPGLVFSLFAYVFCPLFCLRCHPFWQILCRTDAILCRSCGNPMNSEAPSRKSDPMRFLKGGILQRAIALQGEKNAPHPSVSFQSKRWRESHLGSLSQLVLQLPSGSSQPTWTTSSESGFRITTPCGF